MNFGKLEQEIRKNCKDDPRSGIDMYSGDENLDYARTSTEYEQKGDFLWIKLRCVASWDYTSPWDDYSGYDRETTEYSWIGLTSGLTEIQSVEQLDKWAQYKYVHLEKHVKSDAKHECSHEGTKVRQLTETNILIEEAAKAETKWSDEKRGIETNYFFASAESVPLDNNSK